MRQCLFVAFTRGADWLSRSVFQTQTCHTKLAQPIKHAHYNMGVQTLERPTDCLAVMWPAQQLTRLGSTSKCGIGC